MFVVAVPIADRQRSADFFVAAGFALDGAPGDDGLPEPLQVVAGDGVRVMCVPTGGFGWTIGGREVAAPGLTECVLSLTERDAPAVDDRVARCVAAGATVVVEPGPKPWGYVGTVADLDGHLWSFRAAD